MVLCLLDSSARVSDLASLRVSGLGEDYFTTVGKTGKRRYWCDPRVVALLRECAVGRHHISNDGFWQAGD